MRQSFLTLLGHIPLLVLTRQGARACDGGVRVSEMC